MLNHRLALLALAGLLTVQPALTVAAESPAAPVIKIYQRVVASYDGKDNIDNGFFIMKNDRTRRQYFSARTAKLWREVDADTPKGDVDPLDFDPVTNSQDPLVRAFDTSIEKQDAKSATVLVRISGKPGPITQPAPRDLIRYDMVLERGPKGATWLIDDIRGTIDTEWSVRKIMSDYVAMCAQPENIKACH